MREIKFRAWDRNLKSVRQVAAIDWQGEWLSFGDIGESGKLIYYLLGKHEVMQYTGLKDKNGVEIYEGDIIDDQGVTWYVEFGNGQYVLRCTCHYPDGGFYIFEDSPMYKVIGNIYENPELLEAKGE